jgi:antitoxin component of RelBE/YafQ-DinJ toxin-antitoxin module
MNTIIKLRIDDRTKAKFSEIVGSGNMSKSLKKYINLVIKKQK